MYMSPEQALGVVNVSPASDVYSLGTVLYQMLTGHRPYKAKSMVELLKLVQKASGRRLNPWLISGSQFLGKICTRALHRDKLPLSKRSRACRWLLTGSLVFTKTAGARKPDKLTSIPALKTDHTRRRADITRELSRLDISAPIEEKGAVVKRNG